MITTALSVVIAAVGALVLVDAIVVTVRSNFNVGTILTYLFGAVCLGMGVLFDRCPMWLKVAFAVCAVVLCVCVVTLFVFGRTDTMSGKEDALIVLGAGINGETPSRTLKGRLDVAAAYYRQHPDTVIVVSGGQGPQEDITEALAMERYLVEKGVPQTSILQEDRSTSTAENFAFSKAVLDTYFDKPYTVGFVTSEYHVFRSCGVAQEVGLSEVSHLGSPTPLHLILPSGFRELPAIIKYRIL